MWSLIVLGLYCLLIVVGSLLGGLLPTLVRWSHARMQLVLSLVGGLMLAVSLCVLFSHSVLELGSVDRAVGWTLFGMLAMFFLIRAFHFHQHDAPGSDGEGHSHVCSHDHGHGHDDLHHASQPEGSARPSLGFLGISLGLGLHTLIDGIALAASVEAESAVSPTAWLLGLGTFLAIFLHKPLDALSITTVMGAGGWSHRAQAVANVSFALMVPLGAGLFMLSLDRLVHNQHVFVGAALGFSAGAFLCIALGDLLPEIQFHSHHRLRLSAMLLLGVAIGVGVSRLEAAHDGHHHHGHDHGHGELQVNEGAGHEGHAHAEHPHDEHAHDGHSDDAHSHADELPASRAP